MSQRAIYVVCYRSPIFPAHWGLWVPAFNAATEEEGNIGKVIHVEGDARNGFRHQFKRNYDITTTGRSNSLYLIGWTGVENVVEGENSGEVILDTTATDLLEEWALHVPAPAASLRSADFPDKRTRVQIQNCQTWMRDYIAELIGNGMLEQEAMSKLDAVPKN